MGNYPKGSVWASGRVASRGENLEVRAEAQAEDQAATTLTKMLVWKDEKNLFEIECKSK